MNICAKNICGCYLTCITKLNKNRKADRVKWVSLSKLCYIDLMRKGDVIKLGILPVYSLLSTVKLSLTFFLPGGQPLDFRCVNVHVTSPDPGFRPVPVASVFSAI